MGRLAPSGGNLSRWGGTLDLHFQETLRGLGSCQNQFGETVGVERVRVQETPKSPDV